MASKTAPVSIPAVHPSILDSLASEITGSGHKYDKRSTYAYTISTLSPPQCDTIYRSSDIAQLVADLPVVDAIREGFKVTIKKNPELTQQLRERMKELKVKSLLTDAMRGCRVAGGGHILIVTDAPDFSKPLQPGEKVVNLLALVNGIEIYPSTEYRSDPRLPAYGLPKYWMLQPTIFPSADKAQIAEKIHYSRLITFRQPVLSKIEVVTHYGCGPSIFERLWGPIRDFEIAYQDANGHIPVFNQMVRKVRGWKSGLASGKAKDLKDQLQVDERLRSQYKVTIVDAGTKDEPAESLENVAVTVAGLPEIVKLSITRLSAGSGIPPSRLVGEEAKGLNASGVASERTYYDKVAGIQTDYLVPALEQLTLALLAEDGKADLASTVVVEFNPLWQPTKQEQVITDKTQTESDKLKFEMILANKDIYEYVLSLRTVTEE